jgi:RND family efflux transporter MFP subunit
MMLAPVAMAVNRTPADQVLSSWVNKVLAENPEMQAARAAIVVASGRSRAAGQPLFNPELEFEYESSDIDRTTGGINQAIDWADKRGARAAVADLELEVARAELRFKRQGLATDLLQTLADWHTTAAAVDVSEQQSALMARFVRIAEQRRKAGDLSQVELDLAHLAAADAAFGQANANESLIRARQAVTVLTGNEGPGWPKFPRQLPDIDPQQVDMDRLLNDLPSMHIALARVAVASAAVQLRVREKRPDPTIGLRVGKENSETLTGVTLSVPLFLRNNFKAEVDVANAGLIRAPGEIQLNAYATSRVVPRIAAQVLERQARLGDSTEKGQALVTFSSVEMAQAQGDLLVADREWQRVRKLGRDVVSEQRYTEVRVAREQARARVRAYGMTDDEVKQLLDSGKAELADGRFQLLAPQDGTVIRDDFIVGELVESGRVLFEISDESVLWVEARLMPDEAAQIRVNARATMMIHDRRVEGRATQVHHALDEDTRTLGVRIEVPNHNDLLHPGLFVEASIEGQFSEGVLAVPNDAVLRSPDGDWQIFVEHEAGGFEPREVDVIRTTAVFAVIGGVEPGTRVVIRGTFFLQSELAKSGFDIHNH